MADSLAGFTDKLYWRRPQWGLAHCFKRQQGGGYISLCERAQLEKSGGQGCFRPPTHMRCALCDSREITRRGKDESLDESPNWRKMNAS